MWKVEKLGRQVDLQIGDFSWAIWLKRAWWDEKKDKGWLLTNGGLIRGWRKQTRVRVGSQGLEKEANDVWMQWQSIYTIWLWSQAMFSTIGKVIQMWTKQAALSWQSLKFCGRDFQAQVLTSHHLRLEEIYFRKNFLSVLKSVEKCSVSIFPFVWPSSLKWNITKNVLNGFERDCWMSYSGFYYIIMYIYYF